MNFHLTEEQVLLRDTVREFSEREVLPRARDLEEKGEFPRDILKKLAGLGLLGMTVPAEFGGTKTDSLSMILALEELARGSASLCITVSVHASLFCYSILSFGTEAQKKKYLPRAAQGDILGAFSLTEPQAGSDAMNLRTTAVRRGDRYIVNGRKAWVTSGSEADALILLTSGPTVDGKKKLNAFIVEKTFPGFRVARLEEKMGLHSSPTAEVELVDCEVPAENLLGNEGQGASVALHALDYSRIGVAAQAVGIAQRSLEEAVRYATQREAFGKTISEFQAIQFLLADIATLTEAARLLTYRAALCKDSGKPFTTEAAMAKLFASEAANAVATKALQIHGGYGYSREFPIERLYRDARVLSLYEGTSEIQKMVIARNLLQGHR